MESQFIWRTINDLYAFELGMTSLWLLSYCEISARNVYSLVFTTNSDGQFPEVPTFQHADKSFRCIL